MSQKLPCLYIDPNEAVAFYLRPIIANIVHTRTTDPEKADLILRGPQKDMEPTLYNKTILVVTELPGEFSEGAWMAQGLLGIRKVSWGPCRNAAFINGVLSKRLA